MNRDRALDCLAQEGVFMVSPEHAQEVARAFEVTLDDVGIEPAPTDVLALAPLSTQHPLKGAGVRIKHEYAGVPRLGIAGAKAVWMWQLSAMIALHFGLYGNVDHALASPYHKPESECRYISIRGAIRLARHFGGNDGVRALKERNPWIERRLWQEVPFTGTGQRGERLR
ncbi:MAG: hypothetical protein HY323_08160 [Betaproteobacteria bacterium]|nr:hypothetical protein [Betaproteobacteria bacterium]